MSNAARKARKRAGAPYVRARKTPTRRYGDVGGLGLMSGPEVMARILARPSR